MSEEITASATLDVESHLPVFRWVNQGVRARGFILIGVAVMCVLFVAFLGFGNDKMDMQSLAIFVLVSIFSLIFGFRFLRAKSSFIEQIKAIPGYGETLNWLFKDDGYEASTGGSQSRVAWTHVVETKTTPDGVLIYPQSGLYEWVPKSAFASVPDYTRFVDLIAAKTKHSKLG